MLVMVRGCLWVRETYLRREAFGVTKPSRPAAIEKIWIQTPSDVGKATPDDAMGYRMPEELDRRTQRNPGASQVKKS